MIRWPDIRLDTGNGARKRGCVDALVLGRNPANSLEIYASRTLWFRYEKECGVQVVGLAASYDSAVELLQQMITDVYRDRGSVDSDAIRAYFTGR